MAITVLYDVATSDLQSGDIVIRNDEASRFVGFDVTPADEYGTLHWIGTDANSVTTWTTSAQPWNTWPLIIREA